MSNPASDPFGMARWTLALHRLAIDRLRNEPGALQKALNTLDRWQEARGPQASDPHVHEWRSMLRLGPDAVEAAVCAPSHHATTLRNASPLGCLISPQERQAARAEAMRG